MFRHARWHNAIRQLRGTDSDPPADLSATLLSAEPESYDGRWRNCVEDTLRR